MKKIAILGSLLFCSLAYGQNELKNLKPAWELNKTYTYTGQSQLNTGTQQDQKKSSKSFEFPLSYTLIEQNENNYTLRAKLPNLAILKAQNIIAYQSSQLKSFSEINVIFSYNYISGKNEILNWEELSEISKEQLTVITSKLIDYPTELKEISSYLREYESYISTKDGINSIYQEPMNWFTFALGKALKSEKELIQKETFYYPTHFLTTSPTVNNLSVTNINTELKTAVISNSSDLNEVKMKEIYIKKLKAKEKSKTITALELDILKNAKSFNFESESTEKYLVDFEKTIPNTIQLEYSIIENSHKGSTNYSIKTLIKREI